MRLRPMQLADIRPAMTLVEAAQWNQTIADWEMLLNLDGAHFVMEVDNKIVASISALHYRTFIWIAMVLVLPKFRRRGIASYMLQKVLENYSDQIICLDATPDGAKVYEQFSFQPTGTLTRWKYSPGQIIRNNSSQRSRVEENPDIDQIIKLDQGIFGGDRSKLLRWLYVNNPDRIQQDIGGYMFGRRGRNASQIGPLISLSVDKASIFVKTHIDMFPGEPSFLDAFDRPDWNDLLQDLGFVRVREFVRMQRGGKVNFGERTSQFAIAGPELG